ncbi:MAG: hypothetical protein AB3N23_16940 [Paracoccaceae bacterium]
MWRALPLTLALCLALSACIEVPELDQAVPDWVDKAPYPELVMLDGLQQSEPSPETEALELEQTLTARADRLRRRAASLNAGG